MKASMLPFILLLTFLGGCAQVIATDSGPQVVNATTAKSLYQRDWELRGLNVDGRQVVMDLDARVSIRFEPTGQVSGIAAVNRYTGTYILSPEGTLSWGSPGIAATRKAGPPELMRIETDYLKGIGRVNVAILARHMLVLQSVDASTVLTFQEVGF